MQIIQNISLIKDIVGLPKDTLIQICTNASLPTEGNVNDLAYRIWETIREDPQAQNRILESVANRILAGRTATTWYSSVAQGALRGAKQVIIENTSFNPIVTKSSKEALSFKEELEKSDLPEEKKQEERMLLITLKKKSRRKTLIKQF